MDFIEHLIKS